MFGVAKLQFNKLTVFKAKDIELLYIGINFV